MLLKANARMRRRLDALDGGDSEEEEGEGEEESGSKEKKGKGKEKEEKKVPGYFEMAFDTSFRHSSSVTLSVDNRQATSSGGGTHLCVSSKPLPSSGKVCAMAVVWVCVCLSADYYSHHARPLPCPVGGVGCGACEREQRRRVRVLWHLQQARLLRRLRAVQRVDVPLLQW